MKWIKLDENRVERNEVEILKTTEKRRDEGNEEMCKNTTRR
jgi:hypothetical protein